MKLSKYRSGAAHVIRPGEAIVKEDVDELRFAFAETDTDGGSQIVLDLSEVPFIDSAGLELLLELHEACRDSGGNLKLGSPTEICREIFRLTDLKTQFNMCDTVEEATRSPI